MSLRSGIIPTLLGCGCFSLVGCSDPDDSSVSNLRREVQQLHSEALRHATELPGLKATLDAADRELSALASEVEEQRLSLENLQRDAQTIRGRMETVARTGVEPGKFVAGARIDLLNFNGKVFRNVEVKSVNSQSVLIHHADGIARLDSKEVLGPDAPKAPPTPWIPPLIAAIKSAGATPHSAMVIPTAVQSPPGGSHTAVRRPIQFISASKRPNRGGGRGLPVEILAWWGSGSPYGKQLTDAFGTRLVATEPGPASTRDNRPGPWASPSRTSPSGRRSGGFQVSLHPSALSHYKPIGWNYRGSYLDYLYR